MNSPTDNRTFLEHLEELRQVIFRILAAVIIFFPFAFYFSQELISLLVNHSCPDGFSLRYFSPMEPLFVKIKMSLIAALFAALPYVAYVIWQFVMPGLYPREKRVIKRLALSSWLLFFAGVAFCLFFVIPAMMRFSLSMQNEELQAMIGLSNYVGLTGMLLLGFGIMFQLPIVIFFLVLSGMIKLDTMKKLRPIVMIGILVLAALLTPPDIFSQLLMAVPTYLLFEVSLTVSSVAVRRRREKEKAEEETEYVPVKDAYKEDEDFFKPEERKEYGSHYMLPVKKRKLRYISRN